MSSAFAAERLAESDGPPVIVVAGDAGAIADPGSLPVVVAWLGTGTGAEGPAGADVVVDEASLAHLLRVAGTNPRAAVTLALVLRTRPAAGTEAGLGIESAAYSLLQSGPEFAHWRASRPARHAGDTGRGDPERPVVAVERTDGLLKIVLDRPERHNAISTEMRDQLDEALALAEADDSIESVRISGAGPSFCSGGDLDEFGSRPDPATAHVVRLARSPARRMARLAGRTTVALHGAAMGGGIELAAFASRVLADPDTRIALPEVSLGLIPGAGGTVSISDRIGRQRTAALCLALPEIGAETALQWGLVDEIVGHRPT